MPRRVELDLVDPLAEPVVRAHARWILVREPSPLERRAGQKGAERTRTRGRPAGALTLERLGERPVLGEQVVAVERRRLVRRRPYACRCASTNHRCLSIARETSMKRSPVSWSPSSFASSIALRTAAPYAL